jgi:large subunit ribosomal protein L6
VPIPAGITLKQQKDGTLESARRRRTCRAARADARAGRQRRAGRFHRVHAGLDIVGIGYRADVKGKIATFTLGYSHPIEFCCRTASI